MGKEKGYWVKLKSYRTSREQTRLVLARNPKEAMRKAGTIGFRAVEASKAY